MTYNQHAAAVERERNKHQIPYTAPVKKQMVEVHHLTDEQVKAVRQDFATGRVSQKQLALEYGVSRSCISHIVNNNRRVVHAVSYKQERGFDGQKHYFIYSASGEQIKQVETEEAAKTAIGEMSKQERRSALIAEKRELERRIRQIDNELAALDDIPF